MHFYESLIYGTGVVILNDLWSEIICENFLFGISVLISKYDQITMSTKYYTKRHWKLHTTQ